MGDVATVPASVFAAVPNPAAVPVVATRTAPASSQPLIAVSAALASPGRPYAPAGWPTLAAPNASAVPPWAPAHSGACGLFAGALNGLAPYPLRGGRPLVRNLASPRNCPGVWAVGAPGRVGTSFSAPYVYLSGDPNGASDYGAPANPRRLARGGNAGIMMVLENPKPVRNPPPLPPLTFPPPRHHLRRTRRRPRVRE